jgi:hypothetical protein
MKKKSSVYSGARFISLALPLLIMFGRKPIQAQELNGPVRGWVASMPNVAWTYASDRFDGVVLTFSKSETPCQPHLASPARRNPNRPRRPRKANPGNRKPSIPCEQQPIVKMRRHLGRGRRV